MLKPAIDPPSTSTLLPVHHDQRVSQLSEKERASSRNSDRSNSTAPSQYSQSSAQHERQGSSSRMDNAAPLTVGCHITPQSKIISPRSPEPKDVQPITQRYNLAELQRLPPSPRPPRAEPPRALTTRARAWTTTTPAGHDNSPQLPIHGPHSAGSTKAFPRLGEGRLSLSAVVKTVPPL